MLRFRRGLLLSLTTFVVGCNMPTPTEDVATPYLQIKKYEQLNCAALDGELNRLRKVEQQLASAQNARISSSKGYNFFYGWGKGDGMDTVELSKTRGEIRAIQREQNVKKCIP